MIARLARISRKRAADPPPGDRKAFTIILVSRTSRTALRLTCRNSPSQAHEGRAQRLETDARQGFGQRGFFLGGERARHGPDVGGAVRRGAPGGGGGLLPGARGGAAPPRRTP